MKTVVLKGTGRRVRIDGIRFSPGEPVEVNDKLAKELLDGSDRLPGAKFEEAEPAKQAEPEPESTPSEKQ